MWNEIRKLGFLLSRRDVRGLAGLLVCVLLTGLLEVTGIIAILPFMQLVADPGMVESNPLLKRVYETCGFASTRVMLIWMGIGILLLFTVTNLVSVLTNWLIYRSVWSLAHRLSMTMLRQYMRLPYSFYLRSNTSSLVKKAVTDITHLVTGVLLAGAQLISGLVRVILILVLLLLVNPALALLAAGIYGGLYFLVHLLRHRYLERLGSRRLAALRARFITFTEALNGVKTIRVEGASPAFLKRFEEASLEFTRIHPRFQLFNLIPRHAIELIALGSIIGIVVYMLIVDIDLLDAIPMLSLFAIASYKLLPALNGAFVAAAQVSHHLPVIDELYQDLKQHAGMEGLDDGGNVKPLEFRHEIILHQACFEYETSEGPVLKDINLTIRKGARIGIVGSTGSGKSTLIDILVGLLYPQQGSLHVDKTLITPDNVRAWRRLIAYVPQDVFLFDESIRRNIAFGIPEAEIDDERLEAAARLAHIHDFIENDLPQKYQTVVGERGVRLSGGERQRIGLARAFYRRPQLLLLDEATSALDAITQERVVSSLQASGQDLTVVVVAHRFSSIKFCEAIYFVDGGSIADVGTWQQLMNRNEKFRRMAELAS
jgi:ATP-binding cassette subfamily C protein